MAGPDRLVVLLEGYTTGDARPLRFGTRYRVGIAETAANRDGKTMEEAHEFSFTTGRAKIVETWPADGAVDAPVSQRRPIRLRFNARINPGQFDASDIRIRPETSSQPTFYFEEDKATGWSVLSITSNFEHGRDYSVTIGRGLATIAGDRVSNLPFTLRFKTEPFLERRVGPQNDDDRTRLGEERRRR
jgi:hypothetical protein